jgi:hypothetical protein
MFILKKLILKLVLPVFFIPSIVLATSHHSPIQVIQAWGEAVKLRDGKKQYQLLCPDQQAKNHAALQAINWVTGVSSPQVGAYKIEKITHKHGESDFLVRYQILLNHKLVGTVSDTIQVKHGCIAQFNYLSPSGERPTP